MNEERFFFAQDQDSHWYKIPEEKRQLWQDFTRNDIEDLDEADHFNEIFGKYRTGGGISGYSFTDPQKG